MRPVSTLSVVLPNYNHARYLDEALEALIAQSRPADEIIVVDDASTDDSVELIERFVARHPGAGIRLLRNDRNRGVIYSANRGFAEATSDYVYGAAADDRVLPGLFEKSLRLLDQYPQAGVSSALMRLLGADGTDLGVFPSPLVSKEPRYLHPLEVRRAMARHGLFLVGCSSVYRRSAMDEFGGGLDGSIGGFSDCFLGHAIAARHGACFIPEPLAYWRRLETSYSQAHRADVGYVTGVLDTSARLMREVYPDLFPPQFVDGLMRRESYVTMAQLLVRLRAERAGVLDQMDAFLAHDGTWRSRAAGWGVRTIYTAADRLALGLMQANYILRPAWLAGRVRSAGARMWGARTTELVADV